jgi:hypothetical protein
MELKSVEPNIVKLDSITNEPSAITVQDCGLWMNLSQDAINYHTDLIQNLIDSTVEVVENYTWFDIRRKTYIAYYTLMDSSFFFGLTKLLLTRSPIFGVSDITKIEYRDANSIWQTINLGTVISDGVYPNGDLRLEQKQWASIYLTQEYSLSPENNVYRIRVTFTTGYDNSTNLIPESLKLTIKKIVMAYYTNRGDCEGGCTLNGFPVPCDAKSIIDQYSIAVSTFNDKVPSIANAWW